MKSKQPAAFRYIPQYRVLLCATCEFCVLPLAVDRHLKEIHHLSSDERRPHNEAIAQLDLASHDEVVYPGPGKTPILGLPKLRGFTCRAANCIHSCVTLKHMKTHWTSSHGVMSSMFNENVACRPVTLQTFFRGNLLRYFIVEDEEMPVPDSNLIVPSSGRPLKEPSFLDRIETSMDWLLMREFNETTWLAVRPVISSRPSWRDNVLQRCLTIDFLRFTILSSTACKVASQYPTMRALYTTQADKYRSMAIAALPSYSIHDESSNFFAFFNFLRLLGTSFIAREQLRLYDNDINQDVGEVLPDWLTVSRRGRDLWYRHRGQGRVCDAMEGPAAELQSAVHAMGSQHIPLNPDDERLGALEAAIRELPEYSTHSTCLEALQMLRRVWATPYGTHASGFRDMTLMWIARVPAAYLSLVRSNDPAALIVFSYWCVLWSLSEPHCWYMQGHAQGLLTRVVKHLDAGWHDWIAWPISVLFPLTV